MVESTACTHCGEPVVFSPVADEAWHVATGSRWCAKWAVDPFMPLRARAPGEDHLGWLDDRVRDATERLESWILTSARTYGSPVWADRDGTEFARAMRNLLMAWPLAVMPSDQWIRGVLADERARQRKATHDG